MRKKANTASMGLKKTLSPMHVWAIAFGCVIGWGSFINPGKKFLPNSGVAGTAIAMALGALVMIIIAFSYAYMVPKYPTAGGEFTFTKMCFGKNCAFLCGWFLVVAYLTNVPMNSTAIGLIVDGLDGSADILKFGFHYTIAGFDIYAGEMFLAMAALLLLGWLNILGVRKAGFVQTILSSLLVICVFTLVTARRDGDGSRFLKVMAGTGVCFSGIFMILQLIPIPGLSGVHFCRESYFMLIAWSAIGLVFYIKKRKFFMGR